MSTTAVICIAPALRVIYLRQALPIISSSHGSTEHSARCATGCDSHSQRRPSGFQVSGPKISPAHKQASQTAAGHLSRRRRSNTSIIDRPLIPITGHQFIDTLHNTHLVASVQRQTKWPLEASQSTGRHELAGTLNQVHSKHLPTQLNSTQTQTQSVCDNNKSV